MKKDLRLVQCTVNGKEVAEYVDVRESLLDMLRNHLGLTSVKKGCEVGECGACTVIVDGETIDSCIYMAVWAEGKNIRTLEGLEKDGELTRIQEAFIEEGAIQCGFCTPGFVMSATVLLERGEKLTREAIKKHMAGNLCRCTGYQNIVNAVEKGSSGTGRKAYKRGNQKAYGGESLSMYRLSEYCQCSRKSK